MAAAADSEDSWDGENTSSEIGSDDDEEMPMEDIIEKELKNADADCPPTFLRKSGRNLEWDYFLLRVENLKHVAPVKFFRHAPLSQITESFLQQDVYIECFNPFVKSCRSVNWIGKVVHFAGYKALVKFETFENTKPRYAWIDFCSDVPKPLGFSINSDILLFPPYDVRKKYPNFQQELKTRFFDTKVPTIADDHETIVKNSIMATQKYKLNSVVEIVDKTNVSRNRMAKVTAVVGDRVHCTYVENNDENDTGFWLNCVSETLHSIGFSHTIGCEVVGVDHDLEPIFNPTYLPTFPDFVRIEKGMLLEARHPVLTYKLSFCYVAKVLKYGYFKARFGDIKIKDGVDFVFHITSPYIFPCGFAQSHGILPLTPEGYINKRSFSWQAYCKEKNVKAMPAHYFVEREANPFELGMKMEAVDVCRPAYVGPATVFKIANHLLFLHFDGWSRESKICYQWLDWQSTEIYPLGWSALVGHEIQSFPEHHKAGDNNHLYNK